MSAFQEAPVPPRRRPRSQSTLDVVDPDDVASGPILRIEHEVRSCTKADGTKYKSCPIDQPILEELGVMAASANPR